MDVDELRRLPPFAGLTDVGLQRLAVRAAELQAAGGQVLALEGDRGAGMFVLCDGNVEVELRSGRLELGPGDFFGELALLVDDGARVARVRATTPVRCTCSVSSPAGSPRLAPRSEAAPAAGPTIRRVSGTKLITENRRARHDYH